MTKLTYNRSSIFDLGKGDSIYFDNHSYRIEKIARGGMGQVLFIKRDPSEVTTRFSVHRPELALKTIRLDMADERGKALFQRELTVWSAFRHRYVVWLNEILDGGNDDWVAAMDWFPCSLREILIKNFRLEPGEAWKAVVNIFDGLAYAFNQDKVLHLDLKPENVLFGWGDYKISDWGIASIKQPRLNAIAGLPPISAEVSATLNNFGTMLYMAPERFLKGYNSSTASDVFSLGMIWLELLSGALPQDARVHPVECLLSGRYKRLASEALDSLTTAPCIRELILSMIAYKPEERPTSYIELQKLLVESGRNLKSGSLTGNAKAGVPQDLKSKPATQRGLLYAGLEYSRKQTSNLDAVGRKDEAAHVANRFINEFLNDAQGSLASDYDLARMSYLIAYYRLPEHFYTDMRNFQNSWNASFPFVVSLIIELSLNFNLRLLDGQIAAFQMKNGSLNPQIDYYLLQFPVPPPYRRLNDAILKHLPFAEMPVLAPYFAGAFVNKKEMKYEFFTLGQAPDGGTTLRTVMANKTNGNCGPGSDPDSTSFLKLVEAYMTHRRWNLPH